MAENEPEVGTESEEAAAGNGRQTRSLAERLMALDPTVREGTTREVRPSPASAERAVERPAKRPVERPVERLVERPAERRAGWSAALGRESWRLNQAILENSLDEARTYIRVAYMIFLASVGVIFLVSVIAAIFFVGSLASGADWEKLAIVGVFCLVTVVLLVLLQYRPARGFGSAAAQVAQLEATRAHINKSFEFWERFLNERDQSRPLTAQEVAIAVSSLSAASQGVIELETRPAKVTEAALKKDAKQQEAPPARQVPPPSRY